jgi:hypothetical protein
LADFVADLMFSRRCALALVVLGTQAVSLEFASAQPHFDRCRAIADDATRLRCFESATGQSATNAVPRAAGPEAGAWRLVRTPNPAGGPDAVSIMQTADTARSDFSLAGLALRCQDGGFEVLIVLVGALSLKAHPSVVVRTDGNRADFTATILPPGASLLLPKAASELASGPWTNATELTVQIETQQTDGAPSQIRGVIPLRGLGHALPSLLANCSSQ